MNLLIEIQRHVMYTNMVPQLDIHVSIGFHVFSVQKIFIKITKARTKHKHTLTYGASYI